jgi:hypothetical protein
MDLGCRLSYYFVSQLAWHDTKNLVVCVQACCDWLDVENK